ncbi:hypothetical protein M3148_15340 [Georgenia satyanarayanai]|uniref:type IV toxin-antitoxin system AbiEi family antitoxin domain-containing protein n=1 Tax=Georgenia satyanarayanai TaxID=860221 RepID=UPI0020406189|nr:hypothetical protein [Georgenia satyanarayanai]MCM3662353.1 hypothetical protein [Georgenia satyanarayanai]
MAVSLGPEPLPRVTLSRDFGANAMRDAQRGGLVRVSHGAFVEPLAEASTWAEADHLARARVAATAHRLTGRAVLSHESAALVHGLWLLRAPDQVHVTQEYRPRRQSVALTRHAGTLPPEDVTTVDGCSVTSVERTIVDCAKTLHPRDALVVADSGMRLLLDPRRDEPDAVAERAESLRGRLLALVDHGARHGRVRARAVTAHADPLSESPYETVIRWIAVSRGLPPPVLQMRFDVRGHTYYTDLCWRFDLEVDGSRFLLQLLGEYDGEVKYAVEMAVPAATARAISDVVVAEKRREDDLRSLPHTRVVRFDKKDAYREDATFRRLCASLPASYVATLRPVPALLVR